MPQVLQSPVPQHRSIPSLPPHVRGECQGHLRAELVHFEPCQHTVDKYADTEGTVQVAGTFEWWGEDVSNASLRHLMLPRNNLYSQNAGRGSTACWAVRCSPQGFSAYLR